MRRTPRGNVVPDKKFDFDAPQDIVPPMATATTPRRPKARRLWTYDEMAAHFPETNQPTELWDGEIIVSAAPRPSHQTVVMRMWQRIDAVITPRKLGQAFVSPIDVVFSPTHVMQPDVIFISSDRKSIIEEKCIRGVPDLAVEVISGTWRRDRVDKKALYEQFGVREYWIIHPDSRLIEVFTLVERTFRPHARGIGSEAVTSALLPELSVCFAQLEA